MNNTELQIIEQLTGVSPDQIKLADDGFWSRGYVIDNGRIVFKNIVYSHGDLGDGNIFVDDGGKVGIIDFSEMCYFDEAGDFMDVSNEELRAAMLDAYGADDALRKKVRLRVLSKGWNWSVAKGSHADFWKTPSVESFYLVKRWQGLGFKNFLDLGCGLGRHAILFGKSNFIVSCFDTLPNRGVPRESRGEKGLRILALSRFNSQEIRG